MKAKTVTCGMLEATCETVTAAKAALAAKVEAALSGTYLPYVVEYDGYIAVVWRDPEAWYYSLVSYGDNRGQNNLRTPGSCGPHPSREEATRYAAKHIAQLAFCHNGSDDIVADYLRLSDHDRSDYFAWCRWQRGYKAARDNGATDVEARNAASTA